MMLSSGMISFSVIHAVWA